MKTLVLFLALCLAGCTQTRVFSPAGRLAVQTSADGTISYASKEFTFNGNLDHSTPSLARGKAISDRAAGVAGIVTAIGAAAIIK